MAQTSSTFWALLPYIVLVMNIQLCHSIQCIKQTGPCTCETNQGLVDLSPLDSGIAPRFSVKGRINGDQFYYSPCQSFSIKDGCKNTTLCRWDGYYKMWFPIAFLQSSTFVTQDDLQIWYIGVSNYNATVSLKCAPDVEGFLENSGEAWTQVHYVFTLTSKYACPQGGGSGSGCHGLPLILCLILLVAICICLCGRKRTIICCSTVYVNQDNKERFRGFAKDEAAFIYGNRASDNGYKKI